MSCRYEENLSHHEGNQRDLTLEMGCLDSLSDLHLWKYSKLDQIHALATY